MINEIKVKKMYFTEDCLEMPETSEIFIELTNGAVVNMCGEIFPCGGSMKFSTECGMGVIMDGNFTSDDFDKENWCKIEKEIATSILTDFNGMIKDEKMYYGDEPTMIQIEFTDFSLSDANNTDAPHKPEQNKQFEQDTSDNPESGSESKDSDPTQQKTDSKKIKFIQQTEAIQQQDTKPKEKQ